MSLTRITSTVVSANAISAEKIANNAITTRMISDGAITEDLIDSYIPTSISLLTLKKIKKTFDPDLKVNRSWTLIGPYGSGKSSFGLFLSSLLSNPKSNESKISHKSLHSIDSSLSKMIGGLITLVYLLIGIAVSGIIYSEISKTFKNG